MLAAIFSQMQNKREISFARSKQALLFLSLSLPLSLFLFLLLPAVAMIMQTIVALVFPVRVF